MPTAAPTSPPMVVPDRPNDALPVLRGRSRRELRLVRSLARHVHVDRGRFVCREGDYADELYVILRGAVAIGEGFGEVGGPVAVRRLGPGEGFGDVALLAWTPRRTSAMAIVPTDLLQLGRRELVTLLERAPDLGRALLRAGRLLSRGDEAVDEARTA